MRKLLVGLLLLTCLCTTGPRVAQADPATGSAPGKGLPADDPDTETEAKALLHAPESTDTVKEGSLTPGTLPRLDTMLPSVRIIRVEIELAQLTPSVTTRLLAWVQTGGSLWFSDSRMATAFGFQPAPLPMDALHGKEYPEISYAGHKKLTVVSGMVYPAGDHPTVTGFGMMESILLPSDLAHCCAVQSGGDVTPLLRATLSPDDPHSSQLLGAMRCVGRGTIVFKPLTSDGHFDETLLHWVAHYQPGAAAAPAVADSRPATSPTPSSPSAPLQTGPDRLVTAHGDVFYGRVLNIAFVCSAPGAESTYPREALTEIVTDIGSGMDLLLCRDGRRIQGQVRLGDSGIALQATDGHTRTFPKADVVLLEFGVGH